MKLPPSYLQARRKLANRLVDLDWRKLARQLPPMWPGSVALYRARSARSETTRLGVDGLFFIGTNTAGILFAFDAEGRVVIVDECELDERFAVVLARDFDAFVHAFVLTEVDAAARRRREARDSPRRIKRLWNSLDEALDVKHPILRSMRAHAILVEIANERLLAGKREQLLDELSALRKRRPSYTRTLVEKMRKYAADWGHAKSP